MGEIHRAFYGERGGGHEMLAASKDLPAVRGILGATDRPWAIEGEWAPYVSGLPFGNHFVLMRTFPAPRRTGGRGGFVFTDALFIEQEDVAGISDLRRLLALLSTQRPENPSAPQPVLAPISAKSPAFPPDARARAAAREILTRGNSARPVIWLGQDGFEDVLARIWAGLWPVARMELQFRASFDPADAENRALTIVCTPQASRARWVGFPVVDPTAGIDDPSPAEALLAGEPAPLSEFIASLGLQTPNLLALRQAEAAADLLRDLDSLSGEHLARVLRLLVALVPDAATASAEKTQVASRLADAMRRTDASFIHSLRNIAEAPLGQSADHLSNAVQEWVRVNLVDQAARVGTWMRDEAEPWWSRTVRAGMEGAVREWGRGITSALWTIWEAAPQEIEAQLTLALAHGSAEQDLVRTCPPTLSPEVARHVVKVARPERWPELFTFAVASAHGPATAIRRLIRESQGEIEEVLHGLADRHGGATLLAAAVTNQDERVLNAAARRIRRDPDLLSALDPDNDGWRRLWLRAIQVGADAWNGIAHPLVIRNRLLTRALEQGDVDAALLDALASSRLADLTDHPRRRELCNTLSEPARTRFLTATAIAWVQRFRSSPGLEPLPDAPVLSIARRTSEFLVMDSREPARSLEAVTTAFERLPEWKETDFVHWLRSARSILSSLPATGADRLGGIVAQNGWRTAASEFYDGRRSVPLFRAAIPAVFPLLGVIRQWVAALEGLNRGHQRPGWYDALLELALQLYSYGPEHNRIWERAGGDLTRIEGRSAYERWQSAIRLLQSGGGGSHLSPKRLTWEMRSDYKDNPELRALDDSAP